MNRRMPVLLILLWAFSACRPSSRSAKSYDQIRAMVSGKTASEVRRLLGPPNKREALLLGDERWVWWDYTYLSGDNYPPKFQDRVVDLEITFENYSPASGLRDAKVDLRVTEPYGVDYSFSEAESDDHSQSLNKKFRNST